MTTANKITLARIAMVPIFLVCALQRTPAMLTAALVLFCVASLTDFADGYIARKYHQITDFGKFADPLADKLLVTAALLVLVEYGRFAAWMAFVILARELIITGLRTVAVGKGRVMAASWTGKVKTCVQIGGIILLFLLELLRVRGGYAADAFALLGGTTAWAMTLVTLYAGWEYLYKNRDLLRDC